MQAVVHQFNAALAAFTQAYDLIVGQGCVTTIDVTNDEQVEAGVNQVINEQGRIDVLINNAGYGSYGSVEETPIADARRQFDVNIFGLAKLTQLVIPHMRKQNAGNYQGHKVNI